MSTRLEYNVASLREQIEAKCQSRIDAAQQDYAESLDLEQKRDLWRIDAEQSILAMANRIRGKADDSPRDNELESFKIKSCPRIEHGWRSPDKQRDDAIESAKTSRDYAIGRLEAVRASKDGTLSLTPNMLRDWFGL
jgi:hypothetical protein